MHRKILALGCIVAASLAIGAPAARAVVINPLSYDMPNGDGQASGGTFNYWDALYSGTGMTTTDGAPLSGGLGKLTDGIVSTQQWNTVSNVAGTGEYVGWLVSNTPNPKLTFTFAGSPAIDTITIQMDNSQIGSVFAPDAILVDGIIRSFTPPAAGSVGSVTLSGLGLTGGTHMIELRQASSTWTFVSEIAFNGDVGVLPEPATLVLLGLGLAGLATMRRRL
jgi:hypothetical protein